VTSRVVTNRDLAASRCRVEERPHRERHERSRARKASPPDTITCPDSDPCPGRVGSCSDRGGGNGDTFDRVRRARIARLGARVWRSTDGRRSNHSGRASCGSVAQAYE
jgi:hypothetical protein